MNLDQSNFIQSFKFWAKDKIKNMTPEQIETIFGKKTPDSVIMATTNKLRNHLRSRDYDEKLMGLCNLACIATKMDFETFKLDFCRQRHKIVLVKKFVMKYLRDKINMGMQDIADLFPCDRSTVSTHVDDLNGWMENNSNMREQYFAFEKAALREYVS